MKTFDPSNNEAMLDRLIELEEKVSLLSKSHDVCALREELKKCHVLLRRLLPYIGGDLERAILELLPPDEREPIF